jgi:acetylornithine deacetylase/succinyl-diaminopimelate desuccinylase-like protein
MLRRSPVGIDRVLQRLGALYEIGATRVAYSAEEDAAHDLTAGWMEAAGLEVERDDDGNLVGRLRGMRPELPELWSGSHLDSVPNGGRFDGALGVVAALEAVTAVGQQKRTLGVVAFRGEEVGCLGSRARCERGSLPGTFVELHIEQGPRLADAGVPLGLVTGIVGYVRGTITVEGRPGHAGTTPMDARDDALCKAADVILGIRDAARGIDGAVATVGRAEVEPGAANVIPARVTLTIDARAPDETRLDEIVAAIGTEPSLRVEPVAMDEAVRGAVRLSLEELGVPVVELPSGAGHDAGILAAAGVASGMLFVRSLAGGISHSPDEHTSADDATLAIAALRRSLQLLGGT